MTEDVPLALQDGPGATETAFTLPPCPPIRLRASAVVVEGFRVALTSTDCAVVALELTVATQQLLIEELRGHNPESVSGSTASPWWQWIDRIFAGRMLGGPKEERRPETPEGLSPTPAP